MPRDQAAAQVMLRWALGPWAHGHLPVPKGIYPRVYGHLPVPKGIYPWEPGGRAGPKSGPAELRNPDHTANAVGRGWFM